MNKWSNAVVTENGLALLSKLTQGNSLNITRVVAGSGFVTPGLLVKQTKVTDPQQTLNFSTVSYPENGKCALTITLSNDGVDVGYVATQIGIYATDPDDGEILFFIAQATSVQKGTEVPSETEMPGYAAEWTFYFAYGQADTVNVSVDPANTVSRQELENQLANFARKDHVHPEQMAEHGITTAGTGDAYTATVPGITALENGLSFIMIPHVSNTSSAPTLNVNNLGAYRLARRMSKHNTAAINYNLPLGEVIYERMPLRVTFCQWADTSNAWVIESMTRPNAQDLVNRVPVANGGTPEVTSSDNGKFLRVVNGVWAAVTIDSAEGASF